MHFWKQLDKKQQQVVILNMLGEGVFFDKHCIFLS